MTRLFYAGKMSAFFLSLSLLFLTDLRAQTTRYQSDKQIDVSDVKIGISTIYSPDSFYAWGKIRNSSSFSVRGQIWHTSLTTSNFKARIGSEFILTHHLSFPLDGTSGPRDVRTGFGLIPVNILMPVEIPSFITPFAFVSAGGIFLNKKLPESSGASLNYLLNIGAGFEFTASDRLDLQIGYSVQHMSNANTGTENPGIDSHMLFLTFLF